jgi:hypothetical protein
MAILDLQQRARELGRIRIGEVKATSSGKTRPAKLDRFRLTSPSQALLEQVAALYGGTVAAWQPQGGGPAQWEVYTDATRLPVYVPPQPVTQFYELWSGGGCKRRCDGITELLSDRPCVCGPDPADRQCKPTTRLNVVLKDVPGIGVWRLETHGYYAAVELPQAAVFLAQAGGYVDGFLALEERRIVRDGQTRDFMVPTLEVAVTPAQLLAGAGATTALPGGPAGALEAPAPDYAAKAAAATDLDGIRAVWRQARDAGHLTDELQAMLMDAGNRLTTPAQPPEALPAAVYDVDDLWMRIVAACPAGWTTGDLETDFAARHAGLVPGDATGQQLDAYLHDLKARNVA